MGRAFDDLKDGTLLEPFHLNIIYRELRRWRKAKAVPPMVLDAADSSDSPPIFRQGKGGGGGLLRAKVTTAIPTGTIDTPSDTGVVTLYAWDDLTSTSTAGLTDQRVLNDFTISASVPVNTIVKVAQIDGVLWLIASECF